MYSGKLNIGKLDGKITFTDLEGNEREAEYKDDKRIKWIN